jgi:hypothetical protein
MDFYVRICLARTKIKTPQPAQAAWKVIDAGDQTPKPAKGAERTASLEGSGPDEGRGCAQKILIKLTLTGHDALQLIRVYIHS